MKCRQSKFISPYIDQELSGNEKARFEVHLRGCPSCSEGFEGYWMLRRSLSGVESHRAPAWFSQKVLARISEAESQQMFRLPLSLRLAEVLVVLLMIAAGIFSGGLLATGNPGQHMAGFTSSFSLDVFEPAPPDSVGGVYLAMTEADSAQ
jgi:anti-sigma factor RsiW